MKKKNQSNEKLAAITFKTLIIGVDIAKHNQWARFVDCRGIEHNKALKFENNRNGFNAILTRIYEICKNEDFNKVIVGMEPTGHYWKAFANFMLKQAKITVVLVNPYHTKKAKELDDNSQTKSDKKDALTIARLVKDGRYFETYLPHDVYAELRGLTTTRHSMNKRKKAIVNTITAVLDEYFPEFVSVFKHPFKGKASMHLLKVCPILFNEGEDKASIYTYNAGLRNRLAAFSKKYPDLCRPEKSCDQGGVSYVLDKSRLSIRLQPPMSEERRRKASE